MADSTQPALLTAPDPLPDWPGLTLRDGAHLALRSAATRKSLYLDGVFDTRKVNMAQTIAFPFVGTRWKLVQIPDLPGAWRLVCQNEDAFCLGADAPDLRLEMADPEFVLRPMQWLLYRFRGRLMLRTRCGDWLGCTRGAPFCAPVDDLADPKFHWIPETYW